MVQTASAYAQSTSTVISELWNAYGEQTDFSYQATGPALLLQIPVQLGRMSHRFICSNFLPTGSKGVECPVDKHFFRFLWCFLSHLLK